MADKKELEKLVLRKIYNENNKGEYELVDDKTEKPDFIMKDLKSGDLFGVEVTNMYYNQFSAMLKQKPEVVYDMLKNGIYRKAQGILNKHQLYIEFNNSWHYIGNTIGESFKKYDDYINALVNTIQEKNKKAKDYNKSLNYCELFINDRENFLEFKNVNQLSYLENSKKLLKVINDSPFKRIYFFTIIDKKEMLLVLGDMFSGPLSVSEKEMIQHKKHMSQLYKNS